MKSAIQIGDHKSPIPWVQHAPSMLSADPIKSSYVHCLIPFICLNQQIHENLSYIMMLHALISLFFLSGSRTKNSCLRGFFCQATLLRQSHQSRPYAKHSVGQWTSAPARNGTGHFGFTMATVREGWKRWSKRSNGEWSNIYQIYQIYILI